MIVLLQSIKHFPNLSNEQKIIYIINLHQSALWKRLRSCSDNWYRKQILFEIKNNKTSLSFFMFFR